MFVNDSGTQKLSLEEKLILLDRLRDHIFLGILPAQDYIKEKLSWYNPLLGVNLSGLCEIAIGCIYSYLSMEKIGLIFALEGALRHASTLEKGNSFLNRPRGSYFLEIPYNVIKGAYAHFIKK